MAIWPALTLWRARPRSARLPVIADRTLFRPGSISKLFTWTSVMQLVEQGRIDLDADVNTYLDFEKPIAELETRVAELRETATAGELDLDAEIGRLKAERGTLDGTAVAGGPDLGFEAYHGEDIYAFNPNDVTRMHMKKVGADYTVCPPEDDISKLPLQVHCHIVLQAVPEENLPIRQPDAKGWLFCHDCPLLRRQIPAGSGIDHPSVGGMGRRRRMELIPGTVTGINQIHLLQLT